MSEEETTTPATPEEGTAEVATPSPAPEADTTAEDVNTEDGTQPLEDTTEGEA